MHNMASCVSIDVDSGQDKDQLLEFQDIPHDEKWKPVSKPEDDKGKTHTFTNFPHSAVDSDNEEDDSENTEFIREKKTSASFWTFEYYQQFFDVETSQVGHRILGSMTPWPRHNYLDTHIRPNPDLYGPFWICITLVFTTAIAGNLANYIQAGGQNYEWHYDFHKVTFAATAIFSYWWVVPLLLFGVLWWRGVQGRYTFLEMLCLYGYSLAIYIPISILWVIQISWLQWLLVVLGAVMSGSALLLAFWPSVKEDKKQVALAVVTIIFLLHAALAMGFMLYFFHVPSRVSTMPVNITSTAAPTPRPQPSQNNLLDQQGANSDQHQEPLPNKGDSVGGGGGGEEGKQKGLDGGHKETQQEGNNSALGPGPGHKNTNDQGAQSNDPPVNLVQHNVGDAKEGDQKANEAKRTSPNDVLKNLKFAA